MSAQAAVGWQQQPVLRVACRLRAAQVLMTSPRRRCPTLSPADTGMTRAKDTLHVIYKRGEIELK